MRGIAVSAALLLVLYAIAESAYRRRFDSQVALLERRLRESHPGLNIEVGVTRFQGESMPPSLAVDLYEAARLRLDSVFGWPSRLKSDGRASGGSAWPYAFASAWLDPGHHGFLWSPRRLRFVPWSGVDLESPCRCMADRRP